MACRARETTGSVGGSGRSRGLCSNLRCGYVKWEEWRVETVRAYSSPAIGAGGRSEYMLPDGFNYS